MDVKQLFRILKKEAECPLCLETVKNPKTLPCLHSFCLECLDKLANFARKQLQTTIKCPVCQTSFPIPDTDTFANLPSSFHLNRLVDVLVLEDGTVQAQKCDICGENKPAKGYCFVCQSFMCASCFQSHERFKATRGHRNVLIDNLQPQDVEELMHRPDMCSQEYHEDQALEFYCQDCKVLICLKCSIVSHNRHLVFDTQKAAQEQKLQMADAVAKVKAEILEYENKIKKQTELKDKNVADIMNAEKKMIDTLDEWMRDLRQHKKKMKEKFREIYEAEQKQHETQLENLELITTQLKSCVERGQGILERNISTEILQTNPAILRRSDELLRAIKPDVYKSPNFNYLFDKKFVLLDEVLVSKTDPSMCLTEDHDGEVGKESIFVFVTRDSDGLQCYQQNDQIKVDILTPEGDQLEAELKDSKDGKYTVTYTPQRVGQHSIEIRLNGHPLTGSPFVMRVQHRYQLAFQFGSRGEGLQDLNLISDIAVSHKSGKIAVADVGNKSILMFSSSGECQWESSSCVAPISVAFTDCSNLLTIFLGVMYKLQLFNEKGQSIKCMKGKCLRKPKHLSVARDGRLIITEELDDKIKVLSPDGNKILLSFTSPDCAKYPERTVYHENKLFVSYPEAHCIKVFDKAGVFLHDVGCEGSNDGQFCYPVGIGIDKYNQLIVCDVNNQRLQLFTISGKFLSKLQGKALNICNPQLLAINNNNILCVANSSRGFISVFH
ncbi:E3 ubiquitin-protein ligase TRIM71-like [Acropora muricata]|uniref:E3 ubiquitin-protein ligase TRIM71-like n=1 Tax=Acropora muricata TaxID=159855 RepID=UPI0034E41271